MAEIAAGDEIKLYDTFGLCARCSFVDKRGLVWKKSEVVQTAGGLVVLVTRCDKHGATRTLYSSDAGFFHHVMSFSPAWKEASRGSSSSSSSKKKKSAAGKDQPQEEVPAPQHTTSDIEDLYSDPRLAALRAPPADGNLPLIGEVPLALGADKLRPAEDVLAEVARIMATVPAGHTLAVKLTVKYPVGDAVAINALCAAVIDQLDALNEQHQRTASSSSSSTEPLARGPVVLEMPYDRWSNLLLVDDTILLRPSVYPSVLIYVRAGDEDTMVADLSESLAAISKISGVHALLQVMVDRPMPNLAPLLALIRSRRGLVKYVVIGTSRSPKEIMDLATRAAGGGNSAGTSGTGVGGDEQQQQQQQGEEVVVVGGEKEKVHGLNGGSVDPLEIISALERDSRRDGALAVPLDRYDFVPVSAGMVLEPFLPAMGFGRLSIRPSPWCALAAMLVTADAVGEGVPVTRLIDVGKLWNDLRPVHDKLVRPGDDAAEAAARGSKIGLLTGMKIKRAVKSSTRKGVKLPDVVSYLSESSKADTLAATMDNVQVILIHNAMDLSSLDMLRRCRCPVLASSGMTPSGFAASCTGCV
jgi:uncharacterized radical SAM superfamily Fe-S cluster-containing enzyme